MHCICIFLPQVSVIVGHKTLFLYNLHDPDNPVELAFQNRYGSLTTYQWYVQISLAHIHETHLPYFFFALFSSVTLIDV